MRIFKTAWFARFATKECMDDVSLKDAVVMLEAGQFDADLGGGVYKQRLARPGQGKSGGYRLIICFRRGDRAFFMFGFAKSNQANISVSEKADLKQMAKIFFAMPDAELDEKVRLGGLHEITGEKQ